MSRLSGFVVTIIFLLFSAGLSTGADSGYVVYWGLGADPKQDGGKLSSGVLSLAGEPVRDIISISCGTFHALALKSNGTVLGWGGNQQGQATGSASHTREVSFVHLDGRVLDDVVAVAAGWTHSLALRSDGTIVGWGMEGFSKGPLIVPLGLTNMISIATGTAFRMGVNRFGHAIDLYSGQAAPGLSNLAVVAVQRAQIPFGVALGTNGTVRMFATKGAPEYAVNAPALSNAVAIACGLRHNLALASDGTVWGWGFNGNGEATGNPTTTSPFYSSGVVRVGSRDLRRVSAIAAGEGFSLAIREDGTLASWGDPHNAGFAIPEGLSNVVAIAAGQRFCLAITTNAAVAERFRR